MPGAAAARAVDGARRASAATASTTAGRRLSGTAAGTPACSRRAWAPVKCGRSGRSGAGGASVLLVMEPEADTPDVDLIAPAAHALGDAEFECAYAVARGP